MSPCRILSTDSTVRATLQATIIHSQSGKVKKPHSKEKSGLGKEQHWVQAQVSAQGRFLPAESCDCIHSVLAA